MEHNINLFQLLSLSIIIYQIQNTQEVTLPNWSNAASEQLRIKKKKIYY